MQDNKLISTIEALNSLGQKEAITALAKELKEAYDFAVKVLNDTKPNISEISKVETNEENTEKPVIVNTFENKFYDYTSKWSLKNKFQYILKTENRFLHFREVAKTILHLEGKDTSYENQKILAKKMSGNTLIRDLKKDGIIVNVKHQGSLKKSFWGSKKWLDDNGDIKKGHEYSLDIMKDAKKNTEDYRENSLFDI